MIELVESTSVTGIALQFDLKIQTQIAKPI